MEYIFIFFANKGGNIPPLVLSGRKPWDGLQGSTLSIARLLGASNIKRGQVKITKT